VDIGGTITLTIGLGPVAGRCPLVGAPQLVYDGGFATDTSEGTVTTQANAPGTRTYQVRVTYRDATDATARADSRAVEVLVSTPTLTNTAFTISPEPTESHAQPGIRHIFPGRAYTLRATQADGGNDYTWRIVHTWSQAFVRGGSGREISHTFPEPAGTSDGDTDFEICLSSWSGAAPRTCQRVKVGPSGLFSGTWRDTSTDYRYRLVQTGWRVSMSLIACPTWDTQCEEWRRNGMYDSTFDLVSPYLIEYSHGRTQYIEWTYGRLSWNGTRLERV
jgi:hypothetical protein